MPIKYLLKCKHERVVDMRGIVFCASCGEEIERFFGFFKKIKKNQDKKSIVF